MKTIKILSLVSLLSISLLAETKYICQIKQVYDSYYLQIYNTVGLKEVDTMILTLNNGKLIHKTNKYTVEYIEKSSGKRKVFGEGKMKPVDFVEYRQNSSTPMVILFLENYSTMIRHNFEQTYTYSCQMF